jgi:hypothetical protein
MKNMMIYSSDWYGKRTFRMMPVTEDCPFNEAIYDTHNKVLAIISKDQKEKPQMLPKLSDKGLAIPLKGSDPNNPQYVEERRMMDAYYEYYLDKEADIKDFLTLFAINPDHVSISEAMTAEESKSE